MKYLHVYASPYQHESPYIVGTTEALFVLRDAISAAIVNKTSITVDDLLTNDGEGYSIVVKVLEEEKFLQLMLPYPNDKDFDWSKSGIHPSEI